MRPSALREFARSPGLSRRNSLNIVWTCCRSADFKTQIKENSAAHVAVAKIVKELDDRKIKLRKAFKLLDRDKDGTISVEDLPKVRACHHLLYSF